jgi:colanic acid biosynthesis protein WcaH
MNTLDAVSLIKKTVGNPEGGLPEDIFLMISSMTPLVNVDLLVKDEKKRTLLSWRDDIHSGTGWHVPGGIIRYRERFEDRILKVAQSELKIESIKFNPDFIDVQQMIHREREERCHFISFLYECRVSSLDVIVDRSNEHYPGCLVWHDSCPDDLIKYHSVYADFINN